ncbi:hypothetical protein CLV56_1322 [Mumia flava]|uniref:Uncharacterized protein n=1 Tax=Mumia flava TaxID=1348852 RepID=A0A0B2BU17_9ACTN|nr:hypothetical protein [Mumia flava]PJJ57101.1 hypothetical protein CLV56_1322 [Mumia flava]
MRSWEPPTEPVYESTPVGTDRSDPSDDRDGGRSPARHVVGVLIGVLATPVALVAIDWALHQRNYALGRLTGTRSADWHAAPETFLLVALAATVLLGVSAAGRISWLCPAVAGMLYGVVPSLVLVVADPRWLFEQITRLPEPLYDFPFVNVVYYGFVVYPLLAALLLGAYRRPHRAPEEPQPPEERRWSIA